MRALASIILLAFAAPALAHVHLEPPVAQAGAPYRGVLRVGHGCDGAATTALEVQGPAGGATTVRANDKGEFPIAFAAPPQPGPLWLKVVQRCGSASVSWADIPAQGTSTEGMKTPAVLLKVLSREDFAAAAAQPAIEGAWVRAPLPGQPTAAAYMRITVREPMQLVSVSSPAAGTVEVHEMKMEGDVMRMRPAGAVDLAPGQVFELKPGGYHLMMQQLKRPLAPGSTVPLTLVFRIAKGAESRVELQVPVTAQPAPAGHKH